MSDSKEPKLDPPGQNKEVTINVNTREVPWNEKEISFRKVVAIAYPDAVFSPQFIYTVTYSKGDDKKPKGDMVDGGPNVHVKNGMVFDVDQADNS